MYHLHLNVKYLFPQANGQIYQAQIVPVAGPLTSVANTEVIIRFLIG